MAIAYGSTANSTATAATSLTYALNNVAGDVLTVGTCVNDGSALHVTGVTYAAVAMTKGVSLVDDSPGSQTETGIWYLASPATGSNNVVVTSNATLNINSGGISFTGANPSSPIGASTTKQQVDGITNTASLTTSFDNSMIVDAWGMSGTATLVVVTGTNQTSRWVNSTSRTAMGSNETTTTAGSYTLAWAWTTSRISGGCLLEVRELSAASGPANLKSYNTNVKANIKSIDTNVLANIKKLDTNA